MSQKQLKRERQEQKGTDCTKCAERGICCTIIVRLKQNGLKFINPRPAFICEKLNMQTGKCTDYHNRPQECRNWDCNGNPKPHILMLEGRSNGVNQRCKKTKQNSKIMQP